MAESPDIDGLGLDELQVLLVQALEEIAKLKEESALLREEIARLKNVNGKPKIKPSGMEKKSQERSIAKAGREANKKRRRGAKKSKHDADKTEFLKAGNVPAGSRFKGYEDFLVQDLVISSQAINYRRERWLTPTNETIVAPLPAGTVGHFGPELKRFILMQYHKCQVTVPRILEQLAAIGIDISKRQVMRLLIERQDSFLNEAGDVLRTGLETASWVTVDDTGARHKARNGYCTHIGNDQFAWFGTTSSKSRLNFLELLTAGDKTYLIDKVAVQYMRGRGLSDKVIDLLTSHKQHRFMDRQVWDAHLEKLGITGLKVHPDPVRIATEGALWGAITQQGRLDGTVIVSDGAGQFNVGLHALCWVHAERLVHKLDAFTELGRKAKERIQARIWWLYGHLKAYAQTPVPDAKAKLERFFDRIFTSRTGYQMLDRLLARLHAHKNDLLAVLERPDIPLHTNGSENDIRCQVTKRKISGGTRSDQGRDCRDGFLSLMKTCAKQGLSFWDYLGARLAVPGAATVSPLTDLIRAGAVP